MNRAAHEAVGFAVAAIFAAVSVPVLALLLSAVSLGFSAVALWRVSRIVDQLAARVDEQAAVIEHPPPPDGG